MTSSQGDFAQALAGQAQQQTVSIANQITTAALKHVEKAGTQIDASIRSSVNFIEGSNVTLTIADNSASDRVDVTVAATVAHLEHGIATTSAGTVAVSFGSAYVSTPAITAVIVGSAGTSTRYAAIQSASTTGVTLLAIDPSSGNASGTFTIHWIAAGT